MPAELRAAGWEAGEGVRGAALACRTVALELRNVNFGEFDGGVNVGVEAGVPAHAGVVYCFTVGGEVGVIEL